MAKKSSSGSEQTTDKTTIKASTAARSRNPFFTMDTGPLPF